MLSATSSQLRTMIAPHSTRICQKLIAAEATCDVLRNPARQYFTEHHAASMTLANLTVPPGFGDRVGESRSLHAVPTNADL